MSISPVATHDTGIVGKILIGEQMPVRCTVTRVGKIIRKSLSSVASPCRVCLAISALIVLTLNSISCADDCASRLRDDQRMRPRRCPC